MTESQQRPEGALIAAAAKRRKMSARRAARMIGLSESRWRQIVNGYQSVGAGQKVSVIGPAETIARMAEAVGVTEQELREAGRADAADLMAVLREPAFTPSEQSDAIKILEDQLEEALADYTDAQLISEINVRMTLLAMRLQEYDSEAVSFALDPETGHRVVTSKPSTLLRNTH